MKKVVVLYNPLSGSGNGKTEAEKLKRIAAERAKRTLTIKIPDEITVGELAEMLRRTAAEVIKEMFNNDKDELDKFLKKIEPLSLRMEKQ